jgi:hypothetical protein
MANDLCRQVLLGNGHRGLKYPRFPSRHVLTIHTGCTTTLKGHDSSTSSREWPRFLLSSSTRTWQLGLRVRWSDVLTAWSYHCPLRN